MPDVGPASSSFVETAKACPGGQIEIEDVLTALRLLYQKVSSPVIRECLESVRSDIVYLTASAEVGRASESSPAEDAEEDLEAGLLDESDTLAV